MKETTVTVLSAYVAFCLQQGHGGRSGYPGHAHGHMPRNTPPHAHGNWMNRAMGGGGGGRMSEPQPSRGMNDVFVTDNGFRPSGPRFEEFGSGHGHGGMPTDRAGFGIR